MHPPVRPLMGPSVHIICTYGGGRHSAGQVVGLARGSPIWLPVHPPAQSWGWASAGIGWSRGLEGLDRQAQWTCMQCMVALRSCLALIVWRRSRGRSAAATAGGKHSSTLNAGGPWATDFGPVHHMAGACHASPVVPAVPAVLAAGAASTLTRAWRAGCQRVRGRGTE